MACEQIYIINTADISAVSQQLWQCYASKST